jgi:CRISPR-associated protein Csd1
MTILVAAAEHNDRLADRGLAPPYGYFLERISYAIVLSPGGDVADVTPLLESDGKKPKAKLLAVPKDPRTTRTSGVQPFFLWDKTAYVLGITAQASQRLTREHDAFKALHEEALDGTNDEGLRALLAFLRSWTASRFVDPPFPAAMLDTNVVFRLDGQRGYLHDRPAARTIWTRMLASPDDANGLCLVTGERAPIARLHPAIKGVYGTQSSGASIVSFNLDAFTSYGKEQGENAPVSERAAFAYTTALSHLLRPGSRNRVQIADASTVFWAETEPAEAVVRGFLDPPAPDDEGEAARVRDVLDKIQAGRPVEDAAPGVDEKTRYYVLGLSPNAARISVRFWHQDTLGHLAERFREHWADLAIQPLPWRTAPAVWWLVAQTAREARFENEAARRAAAHVSGELMRAILSGARYPRSLLAAVVMRMRADRRVNGMRAAICKACLARDFRKGIEKEDVPMGLNREEPNAAYRLGRLFAVLESVQSAALGNVNATIRDRYYGAASASPASVFPLLLRGTRHHLANLRKGRGAKWVKRPQLAAIWYEQEIGQILDGIGADLPRNLPLGDQGRFAVGYYHERFNPKKDAPEDVAAANSAEFTEDEE